MFSKQRNLNHLIWSDAVDVNEHAMTLEFTYDLVFVDV